MKLFSFQAHYSEYAIVSPSLLILLKYLFQWLQKEKVGVPSSPQDNLDISRLPNKSDDMRDHLRPSQHPQYVSIALDLGFNDASDF